MQTLSALLIFAAILVGIFGAANLSTATTGVGVIGLAVLLAILARLAQAAFQHDELLSRLEPPNTGTRATDTGETAAATVEGSRGQ